MKNLFESLLVDLAFMYSKVITALMVRSFGALKSTPEERKLLKAIIRARIRSGNDVDLYVKYLKEFSPENEEIIDAVKASMEYFQKLGPTET